MYMSYSILRLDYQIMRIVYGGCVYLIFLVAINLLLLYSAVYNSGNAILYYTIHESVSRIFPVPKFQK